ncbi:MAG: hypothetical protein ACOWWM_12715 [Desulfobacterales bacterium]
MIGYRCTLTGDADSLPDLPLPVRSFQARRRTGEPSYLQVVIPDVSLEPGIEARPNGQIVVERVTTEGGVEISAVEIVRVNAEPLRTDLGAAARAITLTGYRQTTNGSPAAREIRDVMEVRQGESATVIVAAVDPAVQPGDTAQAQGLGVEFEIATVGYLVNARRATMEVSG